MLTIQVERDANLYVAVWDEGEFAGDEVLVDIVEAMVTAGIEVVIPPTGPRLAVSLGEPRTIMEALGDYGAVTATGDLPDPTWDVPDGEADI